MENPVVRLRINSLGLRVWNAGKWIQADEQITGNILKTLRNLFPPALNAAP